MINFPHAYSGSVRQPKESVQFVYSEPEVFTEGPDLMAGEAEMALYRSHVRHAEGPERAAGYHEVLLFRQLLYTRLCTGLPSSNSEELPSFIFHHFRTSPVSERCRRASRGYFSRAEGPLTVILVVISSHSTKIYIQNIVLLFQNAFYFCVLLEILG